MARLASPYKKQEARGSKQEQAMNTNSTWGEYTNEKKNNKTGCRATR